MLLLRTILLAVAIVFVLPSAISALLWWGGDRPQSWRDADWSSAALLPEASETSEAAIYILAARTGGLKGAVSEHSWIVVKREGASRYERWDKVGWGLPIRQDAYAADSRWYSNEPRIVLALTGPEAQAAIPAVASAIASYPFSQRGGYRIFPGPNSNSFVAHVLREVPALDVVLPPAAVGRDYPTAGRLASIDADGLDLHLSLWGYAGLSLGWKSGLEINLLGLVAGIDPMRLVVKVPALGTFGRG